MLKCIKSGTGWLYINIFSIFTLKPHIFITIVIFKYRLENSHSPWMEWIPVFVTDSIIFGSCIPNRQTLNVFTDSSACLSFFFPSVLLDGLEQARLQSLISHSSVLSPWQGGSWQSNPLDKIASSVYSAPLSRRTEASHLE